MTQTLSHNTQAILLMTAPLIAGHGKPTADLLTPGEYKRLARHLRDIRQQPADLISPNADVILRACHAVIDEDRLRRLLERGFLLSQVIEHWQARAIWIVSRADTDYPRRLKARLREDAPPVLYGCGDMSLLDYGGLAVVGSRHVDDALIDYTISMGRLAASTGTPIVSGGAKGIDQAAMRGALEGGGQVCGVLADSLEKTAMNREHRNLLLENRLVLISSYDPNAGFNVGHAMQRNKLIYALADAALVVNADVNKGGTWSGAVEQLEKLQLVPVYVRSTGTPSAGLDALREKGALPWPNPEDTNGFHALFDGSASDRITPPQAGDVSSREPGIPISANESTTLKPEATSSIALTSEQQRDLTTTSATSLSTPADVLFASVQEVIQDLLKTPMKDAEIATALNVTTTQAKAWLQRLLEEGLVEKQKNTAGYVAKQQSGLFG